MNIPLATKVESENGWVLCPAFLSALLSEMHRGEDRWTVDELKHAENAVLKAEIVSRCGKVKKQPPNRMIY